MKFKKYLFEIETLKYVDIPNDAYNIWNKPGSKLISIPNSIFIQYNKLFINPIYTTVIELEKYFYNDKEYQLNKKYIRVEFEFNDYFEKIFLFEYDEIMTKMRKEKIKRLIK